MMVVRVACFSRSTRPAPPGYEFSGEAILDRFSASESGGRRTRLKPGFDAIWRDDKGYEHKAIWQLESKPARGPSICLSFWARQSLLQFCTAPNSGPQSRVDAFWKVPIAET